MSAQKLDVPVSLADKPPYAKGHAAAPVPRDCGAVQDNPLVPAACVPRACPIHGVSDLPELAGVGCLGGWVAPAGHLLARAFDSREFHTWPQSSTGGLS